MDLTLEFFLYTPLQVSTKTQTKHVGQIKQEF